MSLPCDVFELLVTYKDKVRPLVRKRDILNTPTKEVFIRYGSGLQLTQVNLSNILTAEMKFIDGISRVTATKFRKSLATLVSKDYHYIHFIVTLIHANLQLFNKNETLLSSIVVDL